MLGKNKSNSNLWRQRIVKEANVCDFSSNDYLSLTQNKNLQRAYQQGFSKYPVGSAASMLVSGYHDIHKEFEEQFCDAYKAEAAILFTSGYAANLAIAAFLRSVSCTALLDKAVHASVYDGIKLSGVQYKRFLHQNYAMLEKMSLTADESTILLVESVYSMGGHFAPLDKLHSIICGLKGMIVDEAHAFGIYGPEGLGGVAHFNLSFDAVPLRVIPLGKSLGAMGAMVLGKKDWVHALLQTARSYIYSTGISPAYVYGMQTAFTMLRKADEKRSRLLSLIAYFRQKLDKLIISYNEVNKLYNKAKNLNAQNNVWIDSVTPIQHLCLGCPQRALEFSTYLLQNGFCVRAIRSPTVPQALSGLRIVLNAKHTEQEIDTLLSLLSSHIQKSG